MNEIIFEIREDESEGGFVARALGYSIVTQAETWEEMCGMLSAAILRKDRPRLLSGSIACLMKFWLWHEAAA